MPWFARILLLVLAFCAWTDDVTGDEVHVVVREYGFDHRLFAEAIAYGIDWNTVSEFAELNAPLEVRVSVFGEDEDAWQEGFDPDNSIESLEEAGYDGREVLIIFPRITSDPAVDAITENLDSIGVNFITHLVPWPQFHVNLRNNAAAGRAFAAFSIIESSGCGRRHRQRAVASQEQCEAPLGYGAHRAGRESDTEVAP